MEPEHLRMKTFQAKIPQEYGEFAFSPASPMPMTPATDSVPLHVGADNARYNCVRQQRCGQMLTHQPGVMNWKMSRRDGRMNGKKSLRVAQTCTSNGLEKLRKRAQLPPSRANFPNNNESKHCFEFGGVYHMQQEIQQYISIY